jgi:hydroxymethylbilane synthase
MSSLTTLRIGTRGSALALVQSNWVAEQLRLAHPGLLVELVLIKTKGDKILDVALSQVGGKGLFVKEIEAALLAHEVDLAVHSMKDLPTALPEGLCLGAVPERVDPRDALVLPEGSTSDSAAGLPLPEGAVVGTSSLRRQAQLLHLRPDAKVADVRGNVDTRLRKLDEGQYDALLLAAAGLLRLGRGDRLSHPLTPPEWLPAVGQGALAIEARTADRQTLALLRPLNDETTFTAAAAERALLASLEGGCQVPIGAYSETAGDTLTLYGFVADPDGARFVRDSATGPARDPESLGQRLAEKLLRRGGEEILSALRAGTAEGEL